MRNAFMCFFCGQKNILYCTRLFIVVYRCLNQMDENNVFLASVWRNAAITKCVGDESERLYRHKVDRNLADEDSCVWLDKRILLEGRMVVRINALQKRCAKNAVQESGREPKDFVVC